MVVIQWGWSPVCVLIADTLQGFTCFVVDLFDFTLHHDFTLQTCVYVTGGVVVVLFLMNYQGHSCSGDRHDLIKCVFKWWVRPENTLFYDHGKETCQATPSSVCTSISREQRWMALICLPYSLIMISVFLSLCDLHMEAGTVEEYKLTLSVQLRDSLTVFEWTPLFGGWFTLCPWHIHTAAVMQSWRRKK